MMDKGFWKDRRVLVTGHTGFKGGWLVLWLKEMGAEVIGLALDPTTEKSLYDIAEVSSGIQSQRADIRNFEDCQKIFTQTQPEFVFHLAAQPLVRLSYEQPIETYQVNVMGTMNILECIRHTPSVRVGVMVTTDKCYENREWLWGYREDEPMGGHDPYSSSKGCAELLISSYRRSYFSPDKDGNSKVAIASARAGNVIGGGDWAENRLIPDLLLAYQRQDRAIVRNPNAIRPWQHVLEPVSGYLLLAEKLHDSGEDYVGAWNFGPDEVDAKPVSWIADALAEYWSESAWYTPEAKNQPHEANTLKLDCSKAKALLGWKPKWSLLETLGKIAEWHQAEHRGDNMRELTLQQIRDYLN